MTLTYAFLLLLAAASASAADGALTGKWQVAIDVNGNERQQACEFVQKESELTGSCQTEGVTVKISGRVEDKKVSWSYKSEFQGQPLTAVFRGSLESATKIVGTVAAAEFGFEGPFTAIQSK